MIAAPSLIVWDWNGTLLDDALLSCEIASEMRVLRGMPPLSSLEEYRSKFCFPIIESYYALGYTFQTETFEQVAAEYHGLYMDRVGSCSVYKEAVPVLSRLQQLEIPQHLLSATKHDRLLLQVADCGLTSYFDGIHGQKDELARGKAETAESLLSDLHVSPNEVLFIGDSTHDAEIAATLGAGCVLLTSGHQSLEALKSAGVPLIDNLADLFSLFG